MNLPAALATDVWRWLGLRSHWADRLLLIVFVVAVRLPGYQVSVVGDWDEGYYALVAREMLHGGMPYVSLFVEKPLGAIVLLAGALGLFGESVTSVRLLGSIVVAASALMLREAALAAGLSRFAAAGAALLYAANSIELGGMATNIEILLAPFIVAACWLGLRGVESRLFATQLRVVAAAGLLVGMGIWIKFLPALSGCVWFAALPGSWLWRGYVAWSRLSILALIYACACLLPTALSGVVYALSGEWDVFWYSNFGFMAKFAALPGVFEEADHPLKKFAYSFLLAGMGIYQLVALAAFGVLFSRDKPVFALAMGFWLLAEVIAVVMPGKYWDHYFLSLLPPLCLLAALGMDGGARRLLPADARDVLMRLPSVLLVIGALGLVVRDFPRAEARFALPDPEAAFAEIIRGDKVASLWVINGEPALYLMTGLQSPTVYGFPALLLGDYSVLIRTDPAVELRRILATEPRYLVLDHSPRKMRWVLPVHQQVIFQAIEANYDLLLSSPGRYGPVLLYRRRD